MMLLHKRDNLNFYTLKGKYNGYSEKTGCIHPC